MKVLTGRGSTDPLPVRKFPGNFVTGKRKNPKSHLGCRSFSTICCFSFSWLGKSWEISEPGEGQLILSRCGKFPDIFEPGAKLESKMSFATGWDSNFAPSSKILTTFPTGGKIRVQTVFLLLVKRFGIAPGQETPRSFPTGAKNAIQRYKSTRPVATKDKKTKVVAWTQALAL